MKIGEIAKASGIPVDSVRYYEKIGLLPGPQRQASGYRDYQEMHLDRLRFIRRCRNLAMTQEEIRELIRLADEPAANCGDIDVLIERHLQHVRERLQELAQLEQTLAGLREACTGPGRREKCGILLGLNPSTSDPAGSPGTAHNHIPGAHGTKSTRKP